MWLCRHHTCSDLIDLDPVSMRWAPVPDDARPPSPHVLADRPVCGSYTVEDGRHYFGFWTADGRFVFADDAGFALPICTRFDDGRIEMLVPGLRIRILQAHAGPAERAELRIEDGDGRCRYVVHYDPRPYLMSCGFDFTAAAGYQTLSDWDFFVGLRSEVRNANARAIAGTTAATHAPAEDDDYLFDDKPLVAPPAPRRGWWRRLTRRFTRGRH